jgi:ABC-2 type transport system permease protein
MKSYWAITRGSLLTIAVYAYGLMFTFVGNVTYIIIIYFLWRSIYKSSGVLNGMSFNETFVYLALASSTFILFKTWADWRMSFSIIDGRVVIDLIKPLDYQLLNLAQAVGFVGVNGLVVTIPSMIVIFLVLGGSVPVGINLFLFPVSLVLAYLMSFSLDYMAGLSSFYSESLWGISMTKEIIVSLLSGALIPLPFFPDGIRQVVALLPFQAIYHSPLRIITSPDLQMSDYVEILAIQCFWVLVLWGVGRLCFNQAVKVVTVNGG